MFDTIRSKLLFPVCFAAVAAGSPATGQEVVPPRLLIDPNPVKTGERTVVFGSGFCDECGPVMVYLGDQMVAAEVEVDSDGRFALAFDALADPGSVVVRAVQDPGPDDGPLESSAELVLGVGEQKPGPRGPVIE